MAERYEAVAVADRGGKFRGDEHLAAQGFAQGLDARGFVDRRPDYGEIEPVDGTDIAVEHLAEMEGQVDCGSRLAGLAPRGVQPVDGAHRLCRGVERLAADLLARRILERERSRACHRREISAPGRRAGAATRSASRRPRRAIR